MTYKTNMGLALLFIATMALWVVVGDGKNPGLVVLYAILASMYAYLAGVDKGKNR